MDLYEIVKQNYPNICQIVASKGGRVLYKQSWNNYSSEHHLHVASVTKSIISLLIGIAIDQNLMESVETRILDFFPEYKVKRGEKTIQEVTLHHLLTMTAPFKFKSEPWTKVCSSKDWTQEVLDLLGGRKGVTGQFHYTTLGIHILSEILTRASAMSTIDFANTYLFEPLGIEPRSGITVQNKEEHIQFITSKSPKDKVWLCDPQGTAAAGFGLCLSADEMLKIGQMCLNDGLYQQQRIVSEEWFTHMLSPKQSCGEKFISMQYGFLWWVHDAEKGIVSAMGDGGNIIYVNKSIDLVVAIASTFKPRVFDRVAFIQKHIEPLASLS